MPVLGVGGTACGSSVPVACPRQDLGTMEESSEIKVEAGISRASWIHSYMAASGKRISSALSYITGEMRECGEGLKGNGSARATRPTLQRSPPAVPRETLRLVPCRPHYVLSFKGRSLAVRTDSLLGGKPAPVSARALSAQHNSCACQTAHQGRSPAPPPRDPRASIPGKHARPVDGSQENSA